MGIRALFNRGPPPAETTSDQLASALRARADAARDERHYAAAAVLYDEVLRIHPDDGPLHVQAGHMFKESGDLVRAEEHYLAARRLMPNEADLALQLGHFYKVSTRLNDAAASYRRALQLRPDWDEPKGELDRLHQSGWRGLGEAMEPVFRPEDLAKDDELGGGTPTLELARAYGRLAPEVAPKSARDFYVTSHDSINLRQFGVYQNTFWGWRRVLRGVETIRGFCISTLPLFQVQAFVNGLPVHRGPVKGPYELEYERDRSRIHKYVFNIWCDLSQFAPGQYELELRFTDARQETRSLREPFVIEPPLSEREYPDSDGVINLDPNASGTLEEQINSRPSVIRPAKRPNKLAEVKSVLVSRADQLGDLVASIPGIMRLRELMPDARLVGLFGPANADLARSLNVFDDIIVVDFRESMFLRTRTLTLAEQEDLRRQFAPYNFDVAIDLSQSLMSRPLLALTGAKFTYGFVDPGWPRLSASVDDAYYDPKNRKEIATHSSRIVALVERLATIMTTRAQIIRRSDLPRERLNSYGIQDSDRFAVLHTGARIVFSRWPHYLELASRILKESDLKVVLFTGDPELRHNLPPDLATSDRVIVIDRLLPFDDFDAFVHYCTVFVGNDSGPKHLASLRGANVVSIHSARINWSEWGQELSGVIISRKLPCAGCHIYHDVDECGKDYVCITAIKLEEVFGAVKQYL